MGVNYQLRHEPNIFVSATDRQEMVTISRGSGPEEIVQCSVVLDLSLLLFHCFMTLF